MRERLPSRLFAEDLEDVKMPPQKKSRTDPDAIENVSWTDDEVELLLGVIRSYSSQKDYEVKRFEIFCFRS